MAKGSAVDEAKKRLRDKLQDIREQEALLHSIINETRQEAESCTLKLLEEKKKSAFFKEFSSVNQKLENALSKLLLIKDAIYSLDEQGSDSSDTEDDNDNKSQISVTTTATEQTVVDSGNQVKEIAVCEEKPAEAHTAPETIPKPQEDVKRSDSPHVKQKKEKQEVQQTKSFDLANTDAVPKEVKTVLKKAVSNTSLRSSESESRLSSARASPVLKKHKFSSSSSIAPVLPRVLSDDIIVPAPIIRVDIPQKVIVIEVENPWSFYAQIINPAYDLFMEEMCLYFSKEANQGYKGGISNLPTVGAYCCAKSPLDNTWYRAQIKEVNVVEETEISGPTESTISAYEDPVLSNIQVKAFLVDEGTLVDVPARHLRPLERRFSHLPAQAIHCMLAGVAPVGCDFTETGFDKVTWSQQCIDWFNMSIKSEDTFTGYLHVAVTNKWRYPVDLYADGQMENFDVDSDTLPSIESNVGYMMLLVGMAKLASIWDSHLLQHAADIEQLCSDEITLMATTNGSEDYTESLVEKDEALIQEESPIETIKTKAESPETLGKENDPIESQANDESKLAEEDVKNQVDIKSEEVFKPAEVTLDETVSNTNRREEGKAASTNREDDKKILPAEVTLDEAVSNANIREEENAVSTYTEEDASEILSVDLPKATFENRYKMKDFEVGPEGFVQVLVSNVKDPSLFYVHLITPDVAMFDEMLEELNDFYTKNDLPMSKTRLDIGDAVITKFSEDGRWYRGVIKHLKIPESLKRKSESCVGEDDDFVYEVLHVDFGSSEWVNIFEVRPVVEKFFDLPMETLPCSLADIAPMEISRDVGSASSTSSSSDNEQKKKISFKLKSNSKKQSSSVKKGIFDDAVPLAAGDEDYNDVFDESNRARSEKHRPKWSNSATRRLKELTLDGKPRVASLKEGSRYSKLPDEPWQVYLYNTNEDVEIIINYALVDESLAVSNVYTKATERAEKPTQQEIRKVVVREEELEDMIANGFTKAMKQLRDGRTSPEPSGLQTSPTSPTGNLMDKWNPMNEDFLSQRNAYTIDTDDPAVATMNISEPKRDICKYFLSRRGCFRGSACTREHSRPGDISDSKLDAFCVKDQRPIDNLQIGRFVLIQVTSIMTPVHFFLRFPFGPRPLEDILGRGHFVEKFDDTDELYELQQIMNEKYSRMVFRNSDLTPFEKGELIAAKFSDDGQWYRCQVNADLGDKYEVCFVDYGNTETVDEKDTRKLLPEFLHLDIQSVEAFLSNVEMKASVSCDTNLSKAAMDCFKDCLGDENIVIARVMSKAINGTLYLELYDKYTNANINSILLKTQYFQEIENPLSKPWDMSKAIAVNTSIVHMIPG